MGEKEEALRLGGVDGLSFLGRQVTLRAQQKIGAQTEQTPLTLTQSEFSEMSEL